MVGETADVPCDRCGGDLVKNEGGMYICEDCDKVVSPMFVEGPAHKRGRVGDEDGW